jgi:hypothetical protein
MGSSEASSDDESSFPDSDEAPGGRGAWPPPSAMISPVSVTERGLLSSSSGRVWWI